MSVSVSVGVGVSVSASASLTESARAGEGLWGRVGVGVDLLEGGEGGGGCCGLVEGVDALVVSGGEIAERHQRGRSRLGAGVEGAQRLDGGGGDACVALEHPHACEAGVHVVCGEEIGEEA